MKDLSKKFLGKLGKKLARILWAMAGFLSIILAIIGMFLPILPTVPFVILAAFCFSKGSDRYEYWLLKHSKFGPIIRNWRAKRAIPLWAKYLASLMILISYISVGLYLSLFWQILFIVCGIVLLSWLWRLPNC